MAEESRKKRALVLSAADKSYIESGRWKCGDSPTGAHCWQHMKRQLWNCIHCGSWRYYPGYYDIMKAETRSFDSKYKRVFSANEIEAAIKLMEE